MYPEKFNSTSNTDKISRFASNVLSPLSLVLSPSLLAYAKGQVLRDKIRMKEEEKEALVWVSSPGGSLIRPLPALSESSL